MGTPTKDQTIAEIMDVYEIREGKHVMIEIPGWNPREMVGFLFDRLPQEVAQKVGKEVYIPILPQITITASALRVSIRFRPA